MKNSWLNCHWHDVQVLVDEKVADSRRAPGRNLQICKGQLDPRGSGPQPVIPDVQQIWEKPGGFSHLQTCEGSTLVHAADRDRKRIAAHAATFPAHTPCRLIHHPERGGVPIAIVIHHRPTEVVGIRRLCICQISKCKVI